MSTGNRTITLVASFGELATAAVNLFISVIVIRAYGDSDFADYLVVSLLLSLFTIPNTTIQVSSATWSINPVEGLQNSTRDRRFRLTTFIFVLISSWLVAVLVAPVIFDISRLRLLAGLPIIPLSIAMSIAAGYLQGIGKLIHWRLLMLFTSILQLPVAFGITALDLDIAAYIISIALPPALFILFVRAFYDFKFTNASVGTVIRWPTLLFTIILSSSISAPVLLGELFFGTRSEIVTLFFAFNLAVSATGVIGSLNIRDHTLGTMSSKNNRFQFAIATIAPLLIGLIFTGFGERIRSEILEFSDLTNTSDNLYLTLTFSTVVWSWYSLTANTRLSQVTWENVAWASTYLCAELFIISAMRPSPHYAIACHALIGLASLLSFLNLPRGHLSKLTN